MLAKDQAILGGTSKVWRIDYRINEGMPRFRAVRHGRDFQLILYNGQWIVFAYTQGLYRRWSSIHHGCFLELGMKEVDLISYDQIIQWNDYISRNKELIETKSNQVRGGKFPYDEFEE